MSLYNMKMVELTRKEYNIIAKKRGVIEPKKIPTQELLNTLVNMIVDVT